MRRTILLILLALVPALPGFAASDVYRWKDANGNVHFADSPPPNGVKYQIVNMATGATRDPAPPKPIATPAPAATANTATQGPGRVDDTPANRARLCEMLKERLALLEGDHEISEPGDSAKLMTPERRAEELAASRSQQRQYCTTP